MPEPKKLCSNMGEQIAAGVPMSKGDTVICLSKKCSGVLFEVSVDAKDALVVIDGQLVELPLSDLVTLGQIRESGLLSTDSPVDLLTVIYREFRKYLEQTPNRMGQRRANTYCVMK